MFVAWEGRIEETDTQNAALLMPIYNSLCRGEKDPPFEFHHFQRLEKNQGKDRGESQSTKVKSIATLAAALGIRAGDIPDDPLEDF